MLPDDNNCLRLNALCNTQNVSVTTQNVRALATRPPWLRGVPILVKRDTKEAFAGSAAFEHVSSLKGTIAPASVGRSVGFMTRSSLPATTQRFQSLNTIADDAEGSGSLDEYNSNRAAVDSFVKKLFDRTPGSLDSAGDEGVLAPAVPLDDCEEVRRR